MLLKYDHTMRPERFHISDLSTPVYLQADGKRFLEFSYNAGYCVVQIRSGSLWNQQEVCNTIETKTKFFYSREAAREFIDKETWRYYTEEGFKPADWIPQELNNYLQNTSFSRPSYQSPSYSGLHGTKQITKSSYQLNQIAKEMARKRLSTELNEGYFIESYIEKLKTEGFKGAYLVKANGIYGEGLEILKIQWRGNVLKIESERGGRKDYVKEFWRFGSEREAWRDAEEKMKGLVEQGFKFKLEKFIPDFDEDESEIQSSNVIKPRNPMANVINVIKTPSGYSCQKSQPTLRSEKSLEVPTKTQQERPYFIFPKLSQRKPLIVDNKSAKIVADFILEGLENRRKSHCMEIGVGTENQEDDQYHEDNSNFQLVPVVSDGQLYSKSSQKQVVSRPDNSTERSPKQAFQSQQLGFSQNRRVASHKEENLCVVCMDEETSMAFIPCGHKKTCEGCCDMIMRKDASCPVCRVGINSTLRIYE